MVDAKVYEKCPQDEETKTKTSYGWGVRHLQMLCMSIVMISLFVARSSISVAILAMTDTTPRNYTNITVYDWDKKTQSLILSAFFWGYVTMQVPGGVISKRFGGKPIIFVAVLTNAIITGLQPMLAKLGGWQMIYASRVMMGLTQACLFPASHTMLGRWLPEQERTALTGIVYGSPLLGTIISMPVSGYLASTSIGWKLVFYCISGLLLLTTVIWYTLSASSPDEHWLIKDEEREYIEESLNLGRKVEKTSRTPWLAILQTKALYGLMSAHIGMAVCFIVFFIDMPTYLERGLRVSLTDSATLSALPYIGMWLGGIISTATSDRLYNRKLLSLTACRKLFNSLGLFGVSIALVVLSFLGPDEKHLAVVTLVAGLFMFGSLQAGFMVNHIDMTPNFAGVTLSVTNFVANFGSVIMPLLTSAILQNDATDVSRWRIVFLLTATIGIVCNMVYLVLGDTKRQPWNDADFQKNELVQLEENMNTSTLEPLEKK